ncbi:SMC-Scp complex subunit ScpB [Leuconostocaceae bacterium ESL0958]|nr:SMC-Scp complex subunit ScpB [Leuconostocaceae bacterium ESL0958]
MKAINQIEALLFVAGEEGLSAATLAKLTQYDQAAIPGLIEDLANHYQQSESALMVRGNQENYALVTRPVFGPLLSAYAQLPIQGKLTQPQLETLVIIAYQQPITRVEIDQIRGVRSAATLQKLQLHQLIESVGRKEELGRPILYGTTATFLDYFGLSDLADLPPLPDPSEAKLNEDQLAALALFDQKSAVTAADQQSHNEGA